MGIYVGVAQSNRALITDTMVGVGTTTTTGAGVAGTEKVHLFLIQLLRNFKGLLVING